MARTTPQHKAQYQRFIDPNYARVEQVNGWEIAKTFEAFAQARLDELPDEGAPASNYLYASHMGAFVRTLDQAKDHFVKAKLAFYAKVGSGDEPKEEGEK
jgi:hypothetical protein